MILRLLAYRCLNTILERHYGPTETTTKADYKSKQQKDALADFTLCSPHSQYTIIIISYGVLREIIVQSDLKALCEIT